MKRIVVCLIAVTTLFLSSGCGPKKLTRGNAKEILDKVGAQQTISQITISLDQTAQIIRLAPATLENASGVINFRGGKGCVPDPTDSQLITGQLAHCQGFIPPIAFQQRRGFLVPLTKPIGWKLLEVTGISDDASAPNDKIVEYTWQFDLTNFPKDVGDILNPTPPAQGKALLRLYDDGWRFVDYAK